MRPNVSNRTLLVALFALSAASVGLKAAAGSPNDGRTSAVDNSLEPQLAARLRVQGFSTAIQSRQPESSIVLAERASCRLSVRDAGYGPAAAASFAQEAAAIGPVRYLYRGGTYDSPPALIMRLDRFANEASNALHLRRAVPVPLALATSAGCNGQDFGLDDVRL